MGMGQKPIITSIKQLLGEYTSMRLKHLGEYTSTKQQWLWVPSGCQAFSLTISPSYQNHHILSFRSFPSKIPYQNHINWSCGDINWYYITLIITIYNYHIIHTKSCWLEPPKSHWILGQLIIHQSHRVSCQLLPAFARSPVVVLEHHHLPKSESDGRTGRTDTSRT